jgi:hypothetical protein
MCRWCVPRVIPKAGLRFCSSASAPASRALEASASRRRRRARHPAPPFSPTPAPSAATHTHTPNPARRCSSSSTRSPRQLEQRPSRSARLSPTRREREGETAGGAVSPPPLLGKQLPPPSAPHCPALLCAPAPRAARTTALSNPSAIRLGPLNLRRARDRQTNAKKGQSTDRHERDHHPFVSRTPV